MNNQIMHPIIRPILDGEEWEKLTTTAAKNINNYYYISNYGRVYNTYNEKILTPSIDSKGYYYYILSTTDFPGHRAFRMHRLIMMTFNYIPGCENLVINHKDGIKTNCSITNLEWCTQSHNVKCAYENGQMKQKSGDYSNLSKITEKTAREICRRISLGENMQEIAKSLNINSSTVYHISSGRSWKEISKEYDFTNKNKKNRK